MRRTAVVTGAAARVGRSIALELAANGFDVAVHYRRSKAPAEEVAQLCRERGADSFVVQADLALVADVQRLVATVQDRWSSLDLLVNNASAFSPVSFADLTVEQWDAMQAVNTRAPFLLAQGFLSQLQTANDGLVVHLCDIGADRPVSGYAHYSVSKAGLVMLVKAMAVELAPRVRTVGISPGQVAWPPDYDEHKRAKLTRRIPLKRIGEPEDIARLVRFVSLEATYLNGAIIPVDGGLACKY